MKFSPCTSLCTTDGSHCSGCGRSHDEITESKALVAQIVQHLSKFNYDDPDAFFKMLQAKSLNNLALTKV